MKIHGFQKMTLLDFPGRVACTVFLGGCDFRCPFCHNSDLLDMNAPAVMDSEDLLEFLKGRKGLLDGVAFTGGEPLMRKDLPELFSAIKGLGYPIKLDTNGNHPEALKNIIGLVDYVAMDIKNSPERYGETIGFEKFDVSNISESIEFIKGSGTDYEFRTTVVREFHDQESFEKIGKWIRGARNYFLQEFTDRDTVMYAGLHAFEKEEMEKFARIAGKYVEKATVRGI